MATSGTTSFNLNIDEVIDEGYERCGLSTTSGYDMRSARRSLDLLCAEWGNRGIHLWKTELNEIALVAGQAEYTVDSDEYLCYPIQQIINLNFFSLNAYHNQKWC